MTGRQSNADLSQTLTDYLAQRRALGFALIEEERHARRFLEWLWDHGNADAAFTCTDAIEWARGQGGLAESYQRQRLQGVRGLARYARSVGMPVEVPPTTAIGGGIRRRAPHIYTQAETDELIGACPPTFAHPHVQATMAVIIGLLAATGMRIGEALRLRPDDIDDRRATLLVRASKHGPDHQIPIHPTTLDGLRAYQHGAHRLATRPGPEAPLIVTTRGSGYAPATIEAYFATLRTSAGWTWGGRAPRLHDFRHTFATTRMIDAYQDPCADPSATLALLATWLGHSSPSHTYWYIQAVPELLALAAQRPTSISAGHSQIGLS